MSIVATSTVVVVVVRPRSRMTLIKSACDAERKDLKMIAATVSDLGLRSSTLGKNITLRVCKVLGLSCKRMTVKDRRMWWD